MTKVCVNGSFAFPSKSSGQVYSFQVDPIALIIRLPLPVFPFNIILI